MTTKRRMDRRESELNAKLRKATRLLVFSLRMHTDDDEKIRQDIATAFNKALEADKPRVEMIDCGGSLSASRRWSRPTACLRWCSRNSGSSAVT